MEKNLDFDNQKWLLQKLLRVMKLTCILILVFVLGTKAASFSQTGKLNLNLKNGTLVEALEQIEDQSEYYFYYNNDEIRDVTNISIRTANSKIEDVLTELLSGTGLTYKVVDRFIVVRKSEDSVDNQQVRQEKRVTGKVTDASGLPLPGVTVVIKSTSVGTITDGGGFYVISDVSPDAILQFSFVGMKSQEIPVLNKSTIDVKLEEESIGIEEVVAIGYGSMKKSDLTGAVTSANVEALKLSPNTNVAQLLQGTVPGLNIGQVTSAGATPDISIRGKIRYREIRVY